ncbi:FkbM family methyltransferase [Patescibacteria group bacterium]
MCDQNHASSSFSKEFISKGPLSNRQWTESKVVELTTLDNLISEYGIPTYIKIDVEGYEVEVLKGLKNPVKTLTFEFVSSMLDKTAVCLSHLDSLGSPSYNHFWGESYDFKFSKWVKSDVLLKELRKKHPIYYSGDIYVKY